MDYLELLIAILAERGITLPEEDVKSAAATHEELRDHLEKLRSIDLRFLPPYIEPASALRWIESYGDDEPETT